MEPTIIKSLAGSRIDRMAQYRNRAEELRVIAEDMLVASQKETLHRIAATYEDMAETLAGLGKI